MYIVMYYVTIRNVVVLIVFNEMYHIPTYVFDQMTGFVHIQDYKKTFY